ncbi:MAG: GH36-type glycosyl hydrolase domain-containing protein, partial [Eubacteriales bacterium]
SERYEELSCSSSGTLYEHVLRAALLVYKRGRGEHGLLKFGGGDWNDGMNYVGIRGSGESVWLTEFCIIIYSRLSRLCAHLDDNENAEFFRENAALLYESVKESFHGSWYLRGYYDDSSPLGKKGNAECEIDSIAQSFALFAELALGKLPSENTRRAVISSYKRLYDEKYGIFRLLAPPFDDGEEYPGYIKGYLPGIRENGGQYTHAAVWAIIAMLVMGKCDEAISALKRINPALMSADASFMQRYKIEPYALAGDVYYGEGCKGRGGWSFYTGGAAWYRRAVIEFVFGFTLRPGGFLLRPFMNEEFDGAELTLDIHNTFYRIRFTFSDKTGLVIDDRVRESDTEKMRDHFFAFDGGKHNVDFCMKKRNTNNAKQ